MKSSQVNLWYCLVSPSVVGQALGILIPGVFCLLACFIPGIFAESLEVEVRILQI